MPRPARLSSTEARSPEILFAFAHVRPESVEPITTPLEPTTHRFRVFPEETALSDSVVGASTGRHCSPASLIRTVPLAPTATATPSADTVNPMSALFVLEV